ncbi:sucrase ferredoxin [Streptomyces sp. NPDC057702]|uniref:sucrase ferredoxin n=1 Tax=unclassified Streptomyces TaxID=2593676 RepID=UPI00369B296A
MSTCATSSRELAEPLAGTAAAARTWLLIEQSGPWGAKALTASHLDPEVGRALERAAEDTGVRVALIRRPGRHADRRRPTRQRVIAAHTMPGRSWMRTTHVTDPATLLTLDFAALGAGDVRALPPATQRPFAPSAPPATLPDAPVAPARWSPYEGDPLALVCTNGKRDRCCALLGRPLAAELAASATEVWEITHIGGHRFSPTLLVLPYGYAYGRATAHSVKEVLASARRGRIAVDGARGRSAWDRPGQAADLAVRRHTGEDRADALTVVEVVAVADVTGHATLPVPATADGAPPGGWAATVAHDDGRAWRVTLAQLAADPPRPESCGAALATPSRLEVVSLVPLPAAPRPAR